MSRKVLVPAQLPTGAAILAPRESLSYLDCRAVALDHPVEALTAWRQIMGRPLPGLALAFRIRDAISARFGVKRIGGFKADTPDHPQTGDHLDFFLIEDMGPDHLVLTERDRHLDVMTCITTTDGLLAVTSSVRTHNLFGRLYMVPVGIAHKIIVNLMLRRLA